MRLLCIFCLIASAAVADVIEVSGEVNGDWIPENEYHLVGDVTVSTNLSVHPGTSVLAVGGYWGIHITGNLHATEASFSSAEPTAGSWQGIYASGTGDVELVGCTIEFAFRGLEARNCTGASLEGCSIVSFDDHGVYAIGTSVAIRQCFIDGKLSAPWDPLFGWKGIQCDLGANALIENNTIVRCQDGVYNYLSSPTVSGNVFAFCHRALDMNVGDCPAFTCNCIWVEDMGDDWYCIEEGTGNVVADPLFCDPDMGDFTLRNDSPCAPNNNDCGVLMGAWPVGCSTSTSNLTWSEMKALY